MNFGFDFEKGCQRTMQFAAEPVQWAHAFTSPMVTETTTERQIEGKDIVAISS